MVNNRGFQFISLLIYALFLNREGVKVPSGNELVYLLYVYKAWHPPFLATDWTFTEATAGHAFFNLTTGWLTLWLSIEKAAWVGRISCWILSFVGLFRLGRHFQIPRWMVWLCVMLWMVQRQALPTTVWTDWIVGGFEAKCPAYICLVFALDAAISRRTLLAGLLTGLAFSFHSAVGMWGGAAIGWAILTQIPWRSTLRFSCAAVMAAIPGLVTSWQLIAGPHAITAQEARFLVTVAEPLCLDPFTFAIPYVLILILMMVFAGLYRLGRSDLTSRMLFQFELALFVFFAFGFVARAMGRFDLVKLYPFRVFTVFAMLLFFWQLASVLTAMLPRRGSIIDDPLRPVAFDQRIVLVCGIVLFLALPSPIAQISRAMAMHLRQIHWLNANGPVTLDDNLETTADFRTAARWVAENTGPKDIIIAPPWRPDEFYYLRRPLIASWNAYRYDDMTGWRRRIESLVGDVSHLEGNIGDLDAAARAHYRNLSTENIAALQHEYGARWLVTTSHYPYREAFATDTYRVYQLPAPLH